MNKPSTCQKCGAEIRWTITEARKRQAVNAAPDPRGTRAVSRDGRGTWLSRTPTAELPLCGWERLHTPHAATCRPEPEEPLTRCLGLLTLADDGDQEVGPAGKSPQASASAPFGRRPGASRRALGELGPRAAHVPANELPQDCAPGATALGMLGPRRTEERVPLVLGCPELALRVVVGVHLWGLGRHGVEGRAGGHKDQAIAA